MQKVIWTLWWQGEDEMPSIVRECVGSMKKHANGAEVIVLEKDNYNQYIEIPRVIKEKFNKGNITITHLSDIIRLELLYKYGGLWLDSTVMVSKDIPDLIFEAGFYTIKNGSGGDHENIAKERWTGFILGGRPGNPVVEGVRQLEKAYWDTHEKLICYFLLDFWINDVYEALPEAKALIDAVPDYEGSVHAQDDSIFSKLSWKKPVGNKVFRKIRSLMRYIKDFISIDNLKIWGFKIQWYTFLKNCTRISNGKIHMRIVTAYNKLISEYIGEIRKTFAMELEKV